MGMLGATTGRPWTHPGVEHLISKAAVEFLRVGLWVAVRSRGQSVILNLLGLPKLGWEEGLGTSALLLLLGTSSDPLRDPSVSLPPQPPNASSARGCQPRDS